MQNGYNIYTQILDKSLPLKNLVIVAVATVAKSSNSCCSSGGGSDLILALLLLMMTTMTLLKTVTMMMMILHLQQPGTEDWRTCTKTEKIEGNKKKELFSTK